jgi:hypothetical protein
MTIRRTIQSLVWVTSVASALILGTAPEANAQSRELWLYNNGAETVEGYFFAGEEIYGWCDQDCYDLDMVLYDANGQVVVQDVAPDANPQVYAPYEGTFYIEVTMPNCSHPQGCAVWLDSTEGF